MSSVNQERLILVTGGNRGIGFHIIKRLLDDPTSSRKTTILLGSRDIKRGQDALVQLGSPSNVHLLSLDMSSRESIVQAVDEIQQKYNNHLSVIINNAAVLDKEVTIENARQTFATNYYGIKLLNEMLMPIMEDKGRIINVSSQLGPMVLREISEVLKEKYTSPTLTFDELNHLVEDFIHSIENNSFQELGYTVNSGPILDGVSKAVLNSLTQIEARQWSTKKNLLIVSVSPGFCATDMTQHASTARSPELGADSILHAVNTNANELKSGAFYRDGEQLPLISKD